MLDTMGNIMGQWGADVVSALVYLAIVVVFVVVIIKCVVPVLNTRRLLGRAARQIRQGENSKRSWQEQDFLGKGALYAHWSEYLNNLFFADGEFHNPSNVEDFINEDTAIYEPGRARLAEAAPGIMVSIGFLGTLIGISTGLRGFSMDDAEQVMTAIRQLVPGMQYAFMTSIVGVIGSIAATLITRVVEGSAQNALGNFYAAMKQNAGVVSVEPMTQIAIYQQEQTALIQQLVNDISGPMADRMAGQMTAAMSGAMGGVQRSLDDFITSTTREQLRGVDIIVQRFIHEMNMSVNGQFDQLARTIEDTCQNQKQMGEQVRRIMEDFGRVAGNITSASQLTNSMLTNMDNYLKQLNTNASLSEEAYQRVAGSVGQMEVVSRQQNGYLQATSKLQSEIIDALERFDETSQKFMELFGENAAASATSLRETAAAVKQSGDVLAANHKALTGGIAKDIDRTYNSFFKRTDESIEQMRWMIEDIKGSVAQLPQSVDAAASLYTHQTERLGDALRRMQDALDDAVDRMAQAMYPNR